METGIAPRARAISLLDKIRRENSGEYGAYLSAVERRSMMTISTGVEAVAEAKTIVLEPHLPAGWEDISIEDLPIGANLVSFSHTRTRQGVIYDIEAKENGWSFVLRTPAAPNSRYFLNGRPVNSSSSGIRWRGGKIEC